MGKPHDTMLLSVIAHTMAFAHMPTSVLIDRRATLCNQPTSLIDGSMPLLRLRGGVSIMEHIASDAMLRTRTADDEIDTEPLAHPTTRSLGQDESSPYLTLRPPPAF